MSLRICTAAVSLLFYCTTLTAQAPRIDKVDPPNWWVNMPAPMLLVKGDHLNNAHFSLGDLPVKRTTISANGHWAELWLSTDAANAGELLLRAETSQGRTEIPFRFDQRNTSSDGFAGFSSRDVMYLIMTDRFADGNKTNDGTNANDDETSPAALMERQKSRGWHGGDLRGIIDHLDYLQHLGITTVWITPVYQNRSPEAYHGYHATDLYAVDEHFGTLSDLKALSHELHARGMKLVLDVVPNHVGPLHPWVDDPPEPTWFHGTKSSHTAAVMDFQPLTDPYAPWRDRRDITEGWFVDALPDNNQENPAVAKYLIQNAIWWTEQGALDGLRIDTFSYVGREFWNQFHEQLHVLYPKLTDVGEVANDDPKIVSSFAGGVTRNGIDTGLWSPLDFPLQHAIVSVFTGHAPMDQLAATLQQDALYPHPERLTPFIDNHDQIRFASEPGGTLKANKLAMAFLLTVRGMPHLYAGDEIFMEGYQDPDNRRDFPGGFAKDPMNAFRAASRNSTQTEMFDWTRQLLELRNTTQALSTGAMQIIYSSHDSIVWIRYQGKERILIALHRGEEDVTLHVPIASTEVAGCKLSKLLLGKGILTVHEDQITIQLPANQAMIAAVR